MWDFMFQYYKPHNVWKIDRVYQRAVRAKNIQTHKFEVVEPRGDLQDTFCRKNIIDFENSAKTLSNRSMVGAVYFPLRGKGIVSTLVVFPVTQTAQVQKFEIQAHGDAFKLQGSVSAFGFDAATGRCLGLDGVGTPSWQTGDRPVSNKASGLVERLEVIPERVKAIYGDFDIMNYSRGTQTRTENEPYPSYQIRHYASDLGSWERPSLDYIEKLPPASWQSGDSPRTGRFAGRSIQDVDMSQT